MCYYCEAFNAGGFYKLFKLAKFVGKGIT